MAATITTDYGARDITVQRDVRIHVPKRVCDEYGLHEGSWVRLWVKVTDPTSHRIIGRGEQTGNLVSGTEISIYAAVPKARHGHVAEIKVLESQ